MKKILLAFFLCGCKCFEDNQPHGIQPNPDKDKYIDKIESVVSDSASALTAISPRIEKTPVRELVDAQVIRLSGVSKPSVKKTEEYKQMLDNNDSKAIQKDKDDASKVQKETDDLWALVIMRDIEVEQANIRADAEFKQKVLWQYSTAGLAVFIAGLLALAFTPFKKSAGIVMAGGMLAMASAWIFESTWFNWIVGVTIGISVIGIAFAVMRSNKSVQVQDPAK